MQPKLSNHQNQPQYLFKLISEAQQNPKAYKEKVFFKEDIKINFN